MATAKDLLAAVSAAEAYRRGEAAFEGIAETFRQTLNSWVLHNREAIARCWLTEREGALLLIVVSKSDGYDEQLHDALIELVATVNNAMGDFPLRVRSLLLPNLGSPERSFLSPVMAKQLFPVPEAKPARTTVASRRAWHRCAGQSRPTGGRCDSLPAGRE